MACKCPRRCLRHRTHKPASQCVSWNKIRMRMNTGVRARLVSPRIVGLPTRVPPSITLDEHSRPARAAFSCTPPGSTLYLPSATCAKETRITRPLSPPCNLKARHRGPTKHSPGWDSKGSWTSRAESASLHLPDEGILVNCSPGAWRRGGSHWTKEPSTIFLDYLAVAVPRRQLFLACCWSCGF